MTDIDDKLSRMITDQLDAQDQEALKQQLDQDPELQKEADFLAALHKGIQDQKETSPGEIGLARLKRDIQREQQQAQKSQRNLWKPLAIAASCLLVVQMFLLMSFDEKDPGIVTMSGEEHYRGPQVQIVFAGDATATQIQQTLNSVQGNIVSGPGAMGIYTVALPESSDYRQVISQLISLAHVEEVIAKQGTGE